MTRAKKFVRCACGQETGLRRWINEGWLRMEVHFSDGSRKFTFTCPTCISRNAAQPPHTPPGACGSTRDSRVRLVRLLSACDGLMEIVEGCLGRRWSSDGTRLVDTKEWCEFYARTYRIIASRSRRTRRLCHGAKGVRNES